jgi:NAD(P)-dependent dehydrogenase (short-subunit alcohol dehydrogenase family)
MATVGKDPVWFITGCSSGLGRELGKLVLERGARTVLTARNPDSVADLAREYPARSAALRLDVTRSEEILHAVQEAEAKFGRIDVLVNNAGYGYMAPLEEAADADIREQFETNLFGPIALMRAVLPGMRTRRQGHIVNLSSVSGFQGYPGTAFYAGSKFAIEGVSESIATELKPLGISVTIVEPSEFRTEFAGRSARVPKSCLPDYAPTVGANLAYFKQSAGKQVGDPKRAAAAIIDAVQAPTPPLRLVLGASALHLARAKIASLKAEMDLWETVSIGADFS